MVGAMRGHERESLIAAHPELFTSNPTDAPERYTARATLATDATVDAQRSGTAITASTTSATVQAGAAVAAPAALAAERASTTLATGPAIAHQACGTVHSIETGSARPAGLAIGPVLSGSTARATADQASVADRQARTQDGIRAQATRLTVSTLAANPAIAANPAVATQAAEAANPAVAANAAIHAGRAVRGRIATSTTRAADTAVAAVATIAAVAANATVATIAAVAAIAGPTTRAANHLGTLGHRDRRIRTRDGDLAHAADNRARNTEIARCTSTAWPSRRLATSATLSTSCALRWVTSSICATAWFT